MSSRSRGFWGSLFGAAPSVAPPPLFPPRAGPPAGHDGETLPPAPPPTIAIEPPRPEHPPPASPPDIPPPAPPPVAAPRPTMPPPAAQAADTPPPVSPGAPALGRPATLASALPDLPPPLPVPDPPAPSPADHGFATFTECRDLRPGALAVARPGFWGGHSSRLLVAPAAPRRDPPPLLEGTERFTNDYVIGWHREPRPTPAPEVACTFAPDAIVTGPGHVWLSGALVTAPEIMPAYVRVQHNLPADGAALLARHDLPLREIAAPCVVLVGHGLHVYGHFVLEMMFRALLTRRLLAGTGLPVRWLMDADAPAWLTRMLHADLGIPREELEFFRPAEERVRLRQAILPGLVHDDNGFHPYADTLLDDLLAAVAPLPDVPPTRRLFVTRHGFRNTHSYQRDCRNEGALVELAEARGFVPVVPEDLDWRRQLALFRNAEIIVGTFGSALHTALVSPAGTRVGVVGMLNPTQSEIAALRGHRMGYLTNGFAVEGQFTVPEDAFAAFLDALCDPAAAARAA